MPRRYIVFGPRRHHEEPSAASVYAAAAAVNRANEEAERKKAEERKAAEELEKQLWKREEEVRRILIETRQLEQRQNAEFEANTAHLATQLAAIEGRRQAQERQHKQVITALTRECADVRAGIVATRATLTHLNIDLVKARAELVPAQQALVSSKLQLAQRAEEYRRSRQELIKQEAGLESILTRLTPLRGFTPQRERVFRSLPPELSIPPVFELRAGFGID